MIGAGNMGSAIARGIVGKGVMPAAEIIVLEPDSARAAAMRELGAIVVDDAGSARDVPVLLLAVKPQMFDAAARALGPLPRSTVVISIMAGLESATIRTALGGEARIIRAMPNTPCQIGLGMTALALGAGARRGDEAVAARIFSTIGLVEMVDESLMHAVTAVSGSGPAYLFLLAEAMGSAAVALGFTPQQARTFVAQTLVGASTLLQRSESPPADLRAAVTSKGGTTEAALSVLQRRGFVDLVRQALAAANNRGVELARPAVPAPSRAPESSRFVGSEEETRA